MLFVWMAGGGFPLDDSWIHQTYGRNLGVYGEWSLLRGEPSAASTAPLYTVLLAIGYALRIPVAFWTHTLGLFSLWGIAAVGARLAERIAPDLRGVGWLTGVLLLFTWQLVWAATSGMETALFGFWTVALGWVIWHETESERPTSTAALMRRGALFGTLTALATLTRPEGAVIATLWSGLLLLARPQGWRGVMLWAIGAAIGFFVWISPYLMLNWRITGGILPTTSAAKQTEYAILLTLSYPRRLWMMSYPLGIGGQFMLLGGVVMFVWLLVRRSGSLLRWGVLLVPLALIMLYAARLPANYQHGRYVLPALPSLVIMGTVGTLALVQAGRRQLVPRVLTRSLLGAAIAGMSVMTVGMAPSIYARDVAVINEEMVASAHWLAENVPDDVLLAVHDIGAVAYFAPRPLLDLAGLVSPEVIPLMHDPDALWSLIESREAGYLMGFPEHIPNRDPSDPRLCLLFETNAPTAQTMGAGNMAVYGLAFDADCPPD